MKIIARIHNSFKSKFGIPRQSGLSDTMDESIIVFEKEYRDENALRGIEGYSHLWLIWQFSEIKNEEWHPTVRPPRLGGNTRMGVFATRSPYRPNPIGLSSVKLIGIEKDATHGSVLKVSGSDLLDGTPILDIKPYLSFTDSHPNAKNGFADGVFSKSLSVIYDDSCNICLTDKQKDELSAILSQDPRPSYHNDENRIYKMEYAQFCVSFKVEDDILIVLSVVEKNNE